MKRRGLLGAAFALALSRTPLGFAQPSRLAPSLEVEVRDIVVPGTLSRRFTLLVPRHLAPHERVPLLVLLHGLGETPDERMGAFAWVERYGLVSAYERLRRAPVAKVSTRADFRAGRIEELNRGLADRPFRGLVIACPYMPDLALAGSELDTYTRWLTDVVVPRARKEAPTLEDTEHTTLDGCSLGGHFSLEVFLRRPDFFGAWGGVQTAISQASAPRYAERLAQAIAKVGARRDVHVETSTGDAFRDGNEALSRELKRRGVAHTFVMPPGPHDQMWLRESGTLEMLLWHDQRRRARLRVPEPDRRAF